MHNAGVAGIGTAACIFAVVGAIAFFPRAMGTC
jgi:hypothetical protein